MADGECSGNLFGNITPKLITHLMILHFDINCMIIKRKGRGFSELALKA